MVARPRRLWLDWVRGLAVIMMVMAHVVDSWTHTADRDRTAFYWATFVGGLAAPAFLFLSGVGTAFSGASKHARGVSRWATTRALVLRGLKIFGLAFLFRLQALALGWGSPVDFLKVDVLNVMGVGLVAAGFLWGAAASVAGRVAVAATATVLWAMASPLIRGAAWVDGMPAPLQWYLRPTLGHTNFTLVPWVAFVLGGLAVGAPLSVARTASAERRCLLTIAALAVCGGGAAYWASWQPSIYPPGHSDFWGASPTFFFVRLALVVALLPVMWAGRRRMPSWLGSGLATLGAASFFIYWIHVEFVYGGVAIPLKRHVPFELTLVAAAAMSWGLAKLVPWTRVWVGTGHRRPAPARFKRAVARLF